MSVSNASIYFICYERLKELLKVDGHGFNTHNIFIASAISKGTFDTIIVISSIATYPLIVIRTVLHDHKHEHNGNKVNQKLGFMDVFRHIKQ
jgi:hypothetical protein